MFRVVSRLLQPIRSLIRLIPAPFLLSVRSRRASVRLLCSSLILLLLNGHLRHCLELDEPLREQWSQLIDAWRGLLWFLDRAPILIDILTRSIELLAVVLACWLIALYLKNVPNYVNAFTATRIVLNLGMKMSAQTQLSLLLSLPCAIAFSIAWAGPLSLFALGYSLFILWMLHVALSGKRMHNMAADYARTQGSLGGNPASILPLPILDMQDHSHATVESTNEEI
jgi:hypothetical protein